MDKTDKDFDKRLRQHCDRLELRSFKEETKKVLGQFLTSDELEGLFIELKDQRDRAKTLQLTKEEMKTEPAKVTV